MDLDTDAAPSNVQEPLVGGSQDPKVLVVPESVWVPNLAYMSGFQFLAWTWFSVFDFAHLLRSC